MTMRYLLQTLFIPISSTLLLHSLLVTPSWAFDPPAVRNLHNQNPTILSTAASRQQQHVLYANYNNNNNDDSNSNTQTKDPLTKASWYAVEAFGNLFGSSNRQGTATLAEKAAKEQISLDQPPASLLETCQRIQDDFERDYFLSGEVDALIYDTECTFSDPFVSFQGRDRFIDNLANLGSFITNYEVKPINFQIVDKQNPTFVTSKVMVKLELGLPWKPILAWPWGVDYTIDKDTCLIVNHKESWDIEPLEGVKQIFRKPTVKINNNNKNKA